MAITLVIPDGDRIGAAVVPSLAIEFQVRPRLKLWVILRNDVYFGSYPEKVAALLAAEREIKPS